MSDEYFVNMIQHAMSELSPDHMAALKHVQIIVADEPTKQQMEALKLRGDDLLLGLYEGVPLTARSGSESGLMGDTITLFKNALIAVSHDEVSLYEQVKRTVWHEVAHYFGIDHNHMDRLQGRS